MTDLVYRATLREANITRQAEWDTGGNIDLSYAGNEFAGEVSEAIDEAVMLIENGVDTVFDLGQELGDVIICIDLIAIRAGLTEIEWPYFDTPAPPHADAAMAQNWVNELGADLQLVCNTIKKLERERHGMPGSRATLDDLEHGLVLCQFDAVQIGRAYGLDLIPIVAAKFNKTSEKVGLKTRYIPTCERIAA